MAIKKEKQVKPIKVVIYGNESGAFDWRLKDPAKYMNKSGKFNIIFPDKGMNWSDLMWADIIVVQGLVDKLRIAMIYAAQQEYGKKIVVEFDDYFRVEKDSPFKMIHNIRNAPEMIQVTMRIADMITTTTPYLADRFRKLNGNVKVLPNFMDMERWDLPTTKNDGDKIRLGWMGSMTHIKDFGEAVWAIKKILKDYPNVEFITLGDPRLKELFKGYNMEAMSGVPFEHYARRIHGLRYDIGIAPLRNTGFTRCKSNIRPLEYGICHVPCVASDVEPYQHFNGEVLLAKNRYEWYNHIKNLIEDREYRETLGENMYKHVKENYDLEKNIGVFIDAYTSLVV